ncbi:conserved hypothetical protein [Aspergillus terreus NIH2624]|uniref:Major facilitator superfamily (MFS) profile domain-containing protein n=1 Tax=Aspergillus terreus (strain NIH 2624 / FGSC A1156) TaxID=341663 RepID=Q0CGI0_ASPTN|nr:uncharacterized protein ATEG_07212 [Aspergillus terreus NIH2624]EAU32596.1 conserved hypothetical protein [Aspergillus terreus NIH2624]
MELTEHSSQSQIDEKAVAHIAHKNNSDPNCSHLENVTPNNEADEALESEVKYPMTFRRFMGFTAMAFLWTGSQIPVYLLGGIPPYIYGDIGGVDRWVWFVGVPISYDTSGTKLNITQVLANLLALAGVCPFVGSLSDLIGRRYVAIIGASLVVIGMIVCTTAKTMNIFIGGMAIAGAGAGVNELTALAATSEMAPTRKRGKYVAILIFTIAPFAPSVMWAQLIASSSHWRNVGAFCAAWSGFGLLITILFYFPPPRVNSQGLTRWEIVSRVDYVGGFLSIVGLILLMAGMQWGGYQYPWSSAHVLAPLILGVVFLIAFAFWEIYGTKYPIFPSRLKQEPRTLGMTLVITFISGANFFSVIMFWPTQSENVYGHDPVAVGIRSIPIGFGIMCGACIVLWLLSVFRGHNKELLIVSSILMTAGCGAMSVAKIDNLYQLWGILTVAGLGIGGIVVPASIITTIICPDVSNYVPIAIPKKHTVLTMTLGLDRNHLGPHPIHPCRGRQHRLLHLLQHLPFQIRPERRALHRRRHDDTAQHHRPQVHRDSHPDHRQLVAGKSARDPRHRHQRYRLRSSCDGRADRLRGEL